ncbi:MAG TPA: hypothetical protein PJ993_02440 [Candidatus Saccharibacteria bacterium]|nr:hypothetical protein [Candidatus Saccharibacteria bacterium]HMT39763.1 hypothetical protein [Candidatus Saccharibacteria bacterium]
MKRNIAIISSLLVFPVTILTSLLISLYFKSTNPDNIDITQSLAYLSQSLVPAIIVMMMLLIIIMILCVLIYRQEGPASTKLPLALLIINIISIALIAIVNWQIGRVQDQYLKDQGRPTIQQYLDSLDK